MDDDDYTPPETDFNPIGIDLPKLMRRIEAIREKTLDKHPEIVWEKLYTCTACQDTGIVVRTDPRGILWGRVCMPCLAARRRSAPGSDQGTDFTQTPDHDPYIPF